MRAGWPHVSGRVPGDTRNVLFSLSLVTYISSTRKRDSLKDDSEALKPVIDGMDGIKISQGLGLQDFDLIRVIGRGSYAKVLLVRLKKSDQVYAMKVVKKELVHDDEVSPAAPAPGPSLAQANRTEPEVCTSLASGTLVVVRCRPPCPGPGVRSAPAGDPAAPAAAQRPSPGLPVLAAPHPWTRTPCGRLCPASGAGVTCARRVHLERASLPPSPSRPRRVRPRPVHPAARRQTLR